MLTSTFVGAVEAVEGVVDCKPLIGVCVAVFVGVVVTVGVTVFVGVVVIVGVIDGDSEGVTVGHGDNNDDVPYRQ